MKTLGLRVLVALIFLLCLAYSSSATPVSAASILEGTVVKIADGDTITILDSDKVQHRIRIAGIDADEKGQPFGNASRKRMGELVTRKEVRVEFNKYDRYGRIVGKVLVTPPDCPTCGKTLDADLAPGAARELPNVIEETVRNATAQNANQVRTEGVEDATPLSGESVSVRMYWK